MITITTTEALAEFCGRAAKAPYVAVDTEFMRERTYYAKLCLIQLAIPGDAPENAVLADPLADGMSLEPLLELFQNRNVVKVFHAARQDVEIFFLQHGAFPEPLFDTQVAAMVCGFGDQVGYETLARKIAEATIDKSSRFTDWSRRPLTDAQKTYALADVTHLRVIYESIAEQLRESGRTSWVEEEMSALTDPTTYVVSPEDAWLRIRTRTKTGRFLAVVKELARFRETYAQSRDVPRNRVLKDEALLELASNKPRKAEDLGRTRLLTREARRGEIADGILAAVKAGMEMSPDDFPQHDGSRDRLQVNPALADLLRVLLKVKAENADVAQKLVASASDLDGIAAGLRDAAALKGWRREVFGADALRLCKGEIGLAAEGENIRLFEL